MLKERSMRRNVLIYGATGYSGRLIAERLRHLRCRSVIAGRTPHRVQALAADHQIILAAQFRPHRFDRRRAENDRAGSATSEETQQ